MSGFPSLKLRATLLGYSALWLLGLPAALLYLRKRAKKDPDYGAHLGERFGRHAPWPEGPRTIWVHAVSLGETRAAAILIEALRAVWPDMRLLLTHSTATGWAQGQSVLRPGDAQAWLPWDTPEATQRFLAHHQPLLPRRWMKPNCKSSVP